MKRRTRAVKLEQLINRDAEPRVRKKQVGLYETTTTAYPPKLPTVKPGESIIVTDDPLPRVRAWLESIGRNIVAIRTERDRYGESVRECVERCSVALTKLHALIREIEGGSVCDLGTVGLAIERAAELADEWHMLVVNANLEKDVMSRRKSAQNIRPQAPTVTDSQILEIIGQGGTRDEQARKLGLTARQLYRRLRLISRS